MIGREIRRSEGPHDSAVVRQRTVHRAAARRDHRGEPPADGGPVRRRARRWSTCRPVGAGPTTNWSRRRGELARALLALGIGQGRAGRDLGAQRARVGARPVRDGADRRDPGQHQPGLPHPRAGLRARTRPASGLLVAAEAFKTSDYRGMVDAGPPGLPRPDRGRLHRTTDWADADRRGARGVGGRQLAEREAHAELRRPDQHPVHLGHDRVPQGRHAVAPQHPQQRLLRRQDAGLDRARTASACRCRSTTASAW